jgi:hypothetical protein
MFYRIAKFIKIVGKRNTYTFASYGILSACLGMNILWPVLLLRKNLHQNSYVEAMSVSVPVLIINYFILMYQNKDMEIFQYYSAQNESKGKAKIYGIIIVVYVVASIYLPVIYGAFRAR